MTPNLIRTVACILVGAMPCAAQSQSEELAEPSCDYGAVSQDAPKGLSQFDFLIGDFTITPRVWQNDAWGPEITSPRARLTGRYILNGRAIVDEWYDNDPGLNPATTRGVTTRVYDPQNDEWKVTWISADKPVVTQLSVAMEDGVLTMRTVSPERPNYDAFFERDGEDRWTRTAFRTAADGTRTPIWQAIGTRIPCDDG